MARGSYKMPNLIVPKCRVEVTAPIIFLAGPDTAARGWHERAIDIVSSIDDSVVIACTSRRIKSGYESLKSEVMFESHVLWERFYLEAASKQGAILFWLPNPVEEMPIDSKTGFHKPYARDTCGEIGEWRGRMIENPSVGRYIAVGYESNYPGIDVILKNFRAVKPSMQFYTSLEETCKEAVRIAKAR